MSDTRLQFKSSDGCSIMKQQGRISLVKDKIHPFYSIWVDTKIVAECGEKNALDWYYRTIEGKIHEQH